MKFKGSFGDLVPEQTGQIVLSGRQADLAPEGADEIVTAFGIGGRDVALRKTVDEIMFDTFHANPFPIDVGSLGPGVGGLIGLDLLRAGQFLLDFDALELRRVDHA